MSDEFLTEDEELFVAKLPRALIARVDAALLAKSENRFRKVAFLINSVTDLVADLPEDLPRNFYALRIANHVEAGMMESRGNLRRPGSSEVRIPSPPLPKAELQQLIASGNYATVGNLYAEGQGVAQDYAEALKWYRLAAEQGEPWSQFHVGRFYLDGHGVQQDYKAAYFWFSLAAQRDTSENRPFRHWRDEVVQELTSEVQAEVDQQAAQWRPTSASRGQAGGKRAHLKRRH